MADKTVGDEQIVKLRLSQLNVLLEKAGLPRQPASGGRANDTSKADFRDQDDGTKPDFRDA
jgi:hypothetical protein